MVEARYDEPRPELPEHGYPDPTAVEVREYIGAFARYKLEEVMSAAHGANLTALKEHGVDGRELVRYRAALQQALRAAIAEGRGLDSELNREVAIAYVGALGFQEEAEVLRGIASNPQESLSARGSALDSLGRLGGEAALAALRGGLEDPHPLIREFAARALMRAGGEGDCERLSELARIDKDPEVVRRAVEAIHCLAREPQKYGVPECAARERGRRRMVEEPSIVRPIGRTNVAPPQTAHQPDGRADSFGGRDLVGERLANERRPRPQVASSYERLPQAPAGRTRFLVPGAVPAPDPCCGETVFHPVGQDLQVIEVAADALQPGRPLPFCRVDAEHPLFPVWVPGAAPSPKILEIAPTGPAIWAGVPFELRLRFHLPEGQSAPILRLRLQMPQSGWRELLFAIDDEAQRRGEKRIDGFRADVAGEIHIEAALFASEGGADIAEAELLALPRNPLSVSVAPQTRGTNGEGPAHFNGSENRFYCYARCSFFNGYPHSVTIGPKVTCRVTDGGNHVTTFDFTIGTSTVPANGSRVLGIYTRHGSSSDVFDVFKDFGDVTMQFTFETSEEDVSGSNVWAAMAQIRLALNFVGAIAAADRAALQSIAENEASAILEQQSLYVSETRRFLLPSSDSDFNRYRDIEMDDNKDSDCTAGSDEADDLRDDWSSPTEWLDIWIVESFSGPSCAAGITGFSPVNGPTGKGGDNSGYMLRRNGRDLTSTNGRISMGRTIAHELGHFLGLQHHDDTSNFMFRSNGITRTDITHGQFRDMADHGFVERFVP